MDYLLFSFPGNEMLQEKLLQCHGFSGGKATFRRFPDGESYVRIESDVRHQPVLALCTLHHPDDKLQMLYFFSQQAKEMGAHSVTLVAPYLAYMRQDKAFHPGEAVTSDLFARQLSSWVDALVTIDPHLHRHHQLSEIYSIPGLVLHARPLIVDYIRTRLSNPVIIGPDEESRQWVSGVAEEAGCPFIVLRKERLGDRQVRVTVPEADRFIHHTPVLVDDIISTGRTMIETIGHLQSHGIPPPVCIGIHAVFAGNAWEDMRKAGAQAIVTTNTIPHPTNVLDVSGLLAEAVESFFKN